MCILLFILSSLYLIILIEEAQQPERYLVVLAYLGVVAGIDGIGCITYFLLAVGVTYPELALAVYRVIVFLAGLVNQMVFPQ